MALARPGNELRVFVSSTFRDLQEEREHLMKKIFPEVRAICQERGITFTEVDLRWGLTHEDQVQGQVLRTCLTEIDKCRPYFIGITGNRYGYVLEPHELYKDGELLAKYPWVEDAAIEGASMIDMEFRYGALSGKDEGRRMKDEGGGNSSPHHHSSSSPARFFFRRERATLDTSEETEDSRKLEELKQRVRASGLPIEEFRDPGQLGESVFDALLEIIKTDFANAHPPTPLEQEHAKHEAFAASRRVAYIPNLDYVRRLNEFAKSEDPPLVIYAESGSGKSSLVSFWAEQMRRKSKKDEGGRMKDEGGETNSPHPPSSLILHPSSFPPRVIEHYVGIGATATDHFSIMRHIMTEIKDMMNREDEIPAKPEELERAFANFLGFTLDNPVIIIIDGINQLTGAALNLEWLPKFIPKNIRLIVTSTVEGTLVQMRERGWGRLGMQPLSEKEREAIVVRYLSDYHKSLSVQQVHRIAADQKCAHPLFLRTLLEELRLFGHHEHLESEIDRYLNTTGTEDLFQQVLERMEEDYNMRFVRDVMSFLWASRGGLTESELAELTGVGRLKISSLTNGLDYHLVKRDEGCMTFFHDYLRRAVEKRYLQEPAKQKETLRKLAEYFQKQIQLSQTVIPAKAGIQAPDLINLDSRVRGNDNVGSAPLRLARELIHTLEKSGDDEKLARTLASIPIFLALWKDDQSSVLTMWQRLSTEGMEPEKYYQAELGYENPELEKVYLLYVARLFDMRGRFDYSIDFVNRVIALAESSNDQKQLEAAHRSIGWTFTKKKEYDQALSHLSESLRLSEEMQDTTLIGGNLVNIANVKSDLGNKEEALEYYSRAAEMLQSSINRRWYANALANAANIHRDLNHYELALEFYLQAEDIYRATGDLLGLSMAESNIGWLHFAQGDFKRAIEAINNAIRISQPLGLDPRNIANDLNLIGICHFEQGMYVTALSYFERYRELSHLHEIKSGYYLAILNMGNACLGMHQYPEARAAYVEAIGGLRKIGNLRWLTEPLTGLVEIEFEEDNATSARQYAEECLAVSETLKMPELVSNAHILLARCDAAEGNVAMATGKLEAMLAGGAETAPLQKLDEEQIADLHYWLWKISSKDRVERNGISLPDSGSEVPLRSTHFEEALARYEALHAKIPKFEFRKRIAELKGERVPMSADDLEDQPDVPVSEIPSVP